MILYRVVQKTDTQFYLGDNFSNSAPILTMQTFMAHLVLPPTKLLLCNHIT